MLYTLIMLVCLSNTPEACEVREEIVRDLAENPGVAFMQAQAFVARWIDEHPGRFVQRWRLSPDLRV
ncbi:hypothetical protein PZN02_004032 [Sinorhizobium garamanticum]|uniref:Uncharacterized protein n=1 Tax=Sinorhizobium garamanticum TaxID=680247 RepID=A0ABY8DJY0_9HYPH|nr:hypothetical protein [Sinorhizobium garamanticum]WEX90488.1 hypothetical protein PZN02_004032 [Sinorhizobium garamanticum]